MLGYKLAPTGLEVKCRRMPGFNINLESDIAQRFKQKSAVQTIYEAWF
jgi:hypothetical protein